MKLWFNRSEFLGRFTLLIEHPVSLSACLQLWVEERMPLATSTDHGHNLQTVQLLIKKNQVLVMSRCDVTNPLPLCLSC